MIPHWHQNPNRCSKVSLRWRREQFSRLKKQIFHKHSIKLRHVKASQKTRGKKLAQEVKSSAYLTKIRLKSRALSKEKKTTWELTENKSTETLEVFPKIKNKGGFRHFKWSWGKQTLRLFILPEFLLEMYLTSSQSPEAARRRSNRRDEVFMSLFVCGTWTENGQRRQDVESEKFKSTLKQLKTEIFPQKKNY